MFVLTTFNGVALPGGVVLPIGPAPGTAGLLSLNDRAFDPRGTATLAATYPYELTYRAQVTAASASALQTALAAQWVLSGVRGALVRTMTDTTTHTTTARLLRIRADRTTSNRLTQDVEYDFAILGPWQGTAHSETWLFGDQYTAGVNAGSGAQWPPVAGDTWQVQGDATRTGMILTFTTTGADTGDGQYVVLTGAAPGAGATLVSTTAGRTWSITTVLTGAATTLRVAIRNNGNAPCRDCVVTVTEAGGDGITAFALQRSPSATDTDHWLYTGSLTAALTIDCGARTVLHGSTNAYSNFSLYSNHVNEGWFTLRPGLNHRIVISATGGTASSYVNFAYYDTWI